MVSRQGEASESAAQARVLPALAWVAASNKKSIHNRRLNQARLSGGEWKGSAIVQIIRWADRRVDNAWPKLSVGSDGKILPHIAGAELRQRIGRSVRQKGNRSKHPWRRQFILARGYFSRNGQLLWLLGLDHTSSKNQRPQQGRAKPHLLLPPDSWQRIIFSQILHFAIPLSLQHRMVERPAQRYPI